MAVMETVWPTESKGCGPLQVNLPTLVQKNRGLRNHIPVRNHIMKTRLQSVPNAYKNNGMLLLLLLQG